MSRRAAIAVCGAMSRRAAIAVCGASALVLGGLSVAQGFVPFRARWPGATAEFRVDATEFPPGSAQLAEVEDQLEAWNQIDGCEFLFTHRLVTQGASALSHGDAVSGVAFSSRMQRNVLGVAFSNDRGQRRFASDVNFNAGVNWVFGRAPRSSREYHFGSTCAHEFGHALGLQHSDRGCRALMGGGCGTPGRVRPFAADDLAGARFLYPGASRATPASSSPSPAVSDWVLDGVRVSSSSPQPGETLTVTVSGTQGGTADTQRLPPLWFVLSANATISAQDAILLQLGEQPANLAAGQRFSVTRQVTLPSSATGERFLGVLIDPGQGVAEADESNNVASARLLIQAPPAPNQDWSIQVNLTPDVLVEGQPVELSYRLTNSGTASADVPEVRLLLSTNDTITTRDTLLETIPGGAGAPLDGRRTFQATLAPGTYFLGAIVDPTNQVAELREDDNAAAAALTVQPAQATAPPQQGSPSAAQAGAAQTAAPSAAQAGAAQAGQAAAAATTPAATTPAATTPASFADARRSGGGGGCSLSPTQAAFGLDLGALLALALFTLGARWRATLS